MVSSLWSVIVVVKVNAQRYLLQQASKSRILHGEAKI